MVRLAAGLRFPRHTHHGTEEEVVVLAEKVSIGGAELSEGDYLFNEAGEEHDVFALSDAVIFVSSQKATPLVDPSVDSGAFRLRSMHPTTTAIVANCPRNLSG